MGFKAERVEKVHNLSYLIRFSEKSGGTGDKKTIVS